MLSSSECCRCKPSSISATSATTVCTIEVSLHSSWRWHCELSSLNDIYGRFNWTGEQLCRAVTVLSMTWVYNLFVVHFGQYSDFFSVEYVGDGWTRSDLKIVILPHNYAWKYTNSSLGSMSLIASRWYLSKASSPTVVGHGPHYICVPTTDLLHYRWSIE